MQTDKNGMSTCPSGTEQYEAYFSSAINDWRVQYDYRTPEGKLFSCVTNSVAKAREERNNWIREFDK